MKLPSAITGVPRAVRYRQAVYGPVGAEGYPAQIFDNKPGVIDHQVEPYRHDHYLMRFCRKCWDKLGPLLQGKLHIYVGSADLLPGRRGLPDAGLSG